jgi:hypothetical protein
MVLLFLSLSARAAEPSSDLQNNSPHPALAAQSTWPGVVVITIFGIFAAAMVAGPIIRANAPEDLPAAAHDEPPGASGHHGADGASPHD